MNRQEAITYLNVIWNRYKAEYEIERETLDAFDMAIEALTVSEDCVSRQDTRAEHDGKSICHTCATNNCPFQSGIYRNNCDFYTREALSAERTGEWKIWNEPGNEFVYCTKCKHEYDQIDLYIGGSEYPNFCPNCGAKMKGR